MTIEVLKASIERCTVEMVKLDSFHLSRLPKPQAYLRVYDRLKDEMIDAVYISPERQDHLANEIRVLANLLKGMPGPVIEKLMKEIITRWLPERTNHAR